MKIEYYTSPSSIQNSLCRPGYDGYVQLEDRHAHRDMKRIHVHVESNISGP